MKFMNVFSTIKAWEDKILGKYPIKTILIILIIVTLLQIGEVHRKVSLVESEFSYTELYPFDGSSIKDTMWSIKSNMSSMESDVSSIRRDMSSIESDVSSIKREISSIESDVSVIKHR